MDIKTETEAVLMRYPALVYCEEKNELQGVLFIGQNDSYGLRISLNPYPTSFPIVYETEERIPKKVHRHIYTDTKSCCFTTQAKAQILLNSKITSLTLFISEILIPYLQNNSYYEINRRYKTEEYSHNRFGVIEGYRDILRTNNDFAIAELILNRIKGIKLRNQDLCYCKSGKILKNCSDKTHRQAYRDFRKISRETLQNDLGTSFAPYFNKLKNGGF